MTMCVLRTIAWSAFAALAGVLLAAGADPANPLPNPGFEEGDAQWQLGAEAALVTPAAARTGKLGLRVGDTNVTATGSSVHSARFPVQPGQKVGVSFWARATAASAGVYLWFTDNKGKLVGDAPICGLKDSRGAWQAYAFEAAAPAGAVLVNIWVHAYSRSRDTADLDDFALTGLPAGVVAQAPPAARPAKPVAKIAPEQIPPRPTPPVIILKFDDVKQVRDGVLPGWRKLAEYLESRQIKGGFGVICQTLEQATPDYVQWIADRRKAGFIEFWYHGYDHATHEVDGVKYNEFNRRPLDQQRQRVSKSQQLAQEKLGFAFETFGPTGGVGNGALDEAGLAAVAADPHLRVVLYPQPMDAMGRQFESQGKLTILDRVWQVNLEGAVGVPDFQRFLAGYAQFPERPYFVLQGHPAGWDAERFAEFERIVDFLRQQHAVFLTPAEYAAQLRAR